jgi:hypothetical protein
MGGGRHARKTKLCRTVSLRHSRVETKLEDVVPFPYVTVGWALSDPPSKPFQNISLSSKIHQIFNRPDTRM